MGTKKGTGQTAPTMEKPKPTEQAKNASIQADTDAHALPGITVRIDKLFCDEDKKLKAFASANIGPFAVHGIRVFENDKGMFINMPSNSYTDAQGNKQYEDVFHPVTKEGRELLVKNVLDAYKQALEQAQTNSQTQSQTSGSDHAADVICTMRGAKTLPVFIFNNQKRMR